MTTGRYQFQGQEVSGLKDDGLTLLRSSNIGFIFQFHHLLLAFTALENVTMPTLMRELLFAVGFAAAVDKRPAELSVGIQQHVAIARVLVQELPLLLADEPTGNLDAAASDEVFVPQRRMLAQLGVTFIVVTHDARLGERCDRPVELVDGKIARDKTLIHSPALR